MHCLLFCNSYCKTTGQPFDFNMYPNYLQYTTVFISLLHQAKQLGERLEMSSEFTKEEDYRVVRKNPETYWQFESTRDCTQLSMMDSQQLCGSRMRPNSDFTGITPDVCPVPSADTTSLLVFPTSVDVSPLGPVTLPSLKSPPCTIERAVLPDIAFPPPAEGDIEEDIWEQILLFSSYIFTQDMNVY